MDWLSATAEKKVSDGYKNKPMFTVIKENQISSANIQAKLIPVGITLVCFISVRDFEEDRQGISPLRDVRMQKGQYERVIYIIRMMVMLTSHRTYPSEEPRYCYRNNVW